VAHLFIVARSEPELYGYLARQFAGEHDVQVIVDRRVGERRSARRGEADVERRQRDRRARLQVAQELSSLGYAFVRLDG